MADGPPMQRLSKFNFLVPIEGGSESWLIYNALTDLGILVDASTARSVSSVLTRIPGRKPIWRYAKNTGAEARLDRFVETVPAAVAVELKKLAFLVEPSKEKLCLENMVGSFLRPSCLKVTIAYSARCQMACQYCFQSGRDNSSRHDLGLVERTIAWSEKYIMDHGMKAVHLGLFGGEPLLDYKLGLAYAREFKQLCDRLSIPLEISLTTNGLNLSSKILHELRSCGLTYVRVTLDGPPAVHDLRRPTLKGSGTFNRIFTNLEMAASLDGFGIGVAVNVDETTVNSIDALLDILQAAGLNDDVEMILEPVLPKMSDYAVGTYRPEKMLKNIAKVFLRVVDREFSTPLLPGLCGSCNATQENSFVIDWNGDLFRCSFTMLEQSLSCGSISADLKNGELAAACDAQKTFARAVDVLNVCQEKQCPYLPLCAGGCRYQAWLKKGDWSAPSCPVRLFDKVAADAFAHSFGLKTRRH